MIELEAKYFRNKWRHNAALKISPEKKTFRPSGRKLSKEPFVQIEILDKPQADGNLILEQAHFNQARIDKKEKHAHQALH